MRALGLDLLAEQHTRYEEGPRALRTALSSDDMAQLGARLDRIGT